MVRTAVSHDVCCHLACLPAYVLTYLLSYPLPRPHLCPSPGEDPHLAGEYATAFVTGYQRAPEAPDTLLVGATCKHFVANSMERSADDGISFGRESFDARVTARDLADSYLAPFQQCVERGQSAGLMCSYNR